MDLGDVYNGQEDQGRGRWFEWLHPVTGEGTGLRVKLAGPDSLLAAHAAAQMVDDLAELADENGRVSGADRAKAQRAYLARLALDWEVSDGGEPIPFTVERIKKFLGVAWVLAQYNAFAVNRSIYFFPEALADADA